MAVAVRPRDGAVVRLDRDGRVHPTISDQECAELLIRAAIAMGLRPRKIRRALMAANRSIPTLYRDYDRLKSQPLRPIEREAG